MLCKLSLGSLVGIGQSMTLKEVLRKLYADRNTFGVEDTTALGELNVLEVLKLKGCNLPPGSFEPIYNKLVVPGILRNLGIGNNKNFNSKDEKMIRKSKNLIWGIKYWWCECV